MAIGRYAFVKERGRLQAPRNFFGRTSMSLSTGCVNASVAGPRNPARRFLIRLLILTVALTAALTLIPVARSGTNLKQREHRQVQSLHRYSSTLAFFRHHPRLARTRVGRREVRRARVWVRVIRRELAETRAQLRPRYSVPGWWLSGAMCVHSKESGIWTIENPPYSGGMQMDYAFQRNYGPEFIARYGTAGSWPPSVQLLVAYRGWLVQGWGAWPNTSRACGLR